MICPNCGEENSNESLNCKKCNTQLNNLTNIQNVNQETPVSVVNPQLQEIQPNTNINNIVVDTQASVNLDTNNNSVSSNIEQPTITNITENITPEQPTITNPTETLTPEQPTIANPTETLTPEQPTNNINNNKKTNIPKKPIIIVASIVVGLILCIVVVKNIASNTSKKTTSGIEEISKSDAFFIKNQDGKYAIFNKEGEKLTDFIYNEADDFFNGYSLVAKDDKKAIVDTKGKITVDFGKYEYMHSRSGLFEVEDNKDNKLLIDGKGKKIKDLKDSSVITTYDEKIFTIIEEKNKYTLINYQGKEILNFPIVEDAESVKFSIEGNYGIAFYNGKIYVFDAYNAKKIAEFKSNVGYCISSISEDERKMSISSCGSWYDDDDEVEKSVKMVVDGKVNDVKEECNSITFEGNFAICVNKYDKFVLDKNLKKAFQIEYGDSTSFMPKGAQYIDTENYAVSQDGGVAIYKNGKQKNTIKCATISESQQVFNNTYVLYFYKDSGCNSEGSYYQYYDDNGNIKLKKEYQSAHPFNEYGKAVVKVLNYYLTNEKEEKLSGEYDIIEELNTKGYYKAEKDSKYGLLDQEGKEIFECKYKYTDVKKINDGYIAYAVDKENKYTVYNIQTKKIILEEKTDSSIEFESNYFEYKSGNERYYYTYNGKMFYKE